MTYYTAFYDFCKRSSFFFDRKRKQGYITIHTIGMSEFIVRSEPE